jgi:hypothetical protein
MNGPLHTVDLSYLDQYPKYYPFAFINCTTFLLVPCINSA